MAKGYPKPKQWFPKNPQKYKGDINNIWVRSSWERKTLNYLDLNPNVIEYSCEEVIIPYLSPIDGKYHRYFVDVYAKIKRNNEIKEYLIEIKPYEQTIEPKPQKRITKNYANEVYRWSINSSKWKAAKEYCRKRNMEFRLLTEKDVNF